MRLLLLTLLPTSSAIAAAVLTAAANAAVCAFAVPASVLLITEPVVAVDANAASCTKTFVPHNLMLVLLLE